MSKQSDVKTIHEFLAASPNVDVGLMFALGGFTEALLGEHYCNGLVFSNIVDGAEILGVLALAVAGDPTQRQLLAHLLDTGRLRDCSLEEAENAGRLAGILRWFGLQYSGVGGVTLEKAAALEEAAAERVVARLRVEVREGTIGRCRSCGSTCLPWFPLCDRCNRTRR